MVATLVRLRFLLLANGLRKSPFQIVAVVLGGGYGLFLLVTAVAGLVLLRTADVDFARTIVVLAGGATVLGWTFLPVLTAGVDQTVDTARLAPFPVPLNTLLLALAVSGVLGVPGIVTLVAALGTVVTWSRDPLSAVTALVCAVLAVVTAVVGSRMLAALASRVGAGRRAREARTLLVFVPLMLLGPIIFLVSGALRNVSDILPTIAEVVGWTPFGAAWAVPADVASGEFGKAGLEFLIALATLAIFVALWRWGLARALERPARTAA
ncbi:MAG: transporter, partial [Actinobacteria bacterium]|nr:transporter [Actinomycetota bacterium]